MKEVSCMNHRGSIHASLLALIFFALMFLGVFHYLIMPGLGKVTKAMDRTNVEFQVGGK